MFKMLKEDPDHDFIGKGHPLDHLDDRPYPSLLLPLKNIKVSK